MPSTRRFSLPLVTLAALSLPVLAPPAAAGTLQGRVLAPDRAPLAGIRIQVASAAAGIALETRTAEDGTYTMPDLPAGSDYVIKVAAKCDTYATMAQDRVVVRERGITRESFQLFPSIVEVIRVRAEQARSLVDLAEVGTRTRYTGEFLAGLPVTCSP